MNARKKTLKPKLATETWLKRGLLDLYLAFVHTGLLNYRIFLLQQGLEKFCKAFLIGSQRHQYEHLDSNKASKWIDDFSRSFGHDLRVLIGLASIGIKGLESWLGDEALIDILNRAYEEGRYPIPIGKSIWSKHGFPALASSDLDHKALQLATVLWDGVVNYFREQGEVIAIPFEHPIDDTIDQKEWDRFMTIWRMRSAKALAKQIEVANEAPIRV